MKLVNKIADYLIGTETLNYYADMRKFYSENIKDNEILERRLNEIGFDELKHALVGKIFPDLADISSALLAYSMKSTLPLLCAAAAECFRVYMIEDFEFNKSKYAADRLKLAANGLSKPESQEKLAEKLNGK